MRAIHLISSLSSRSGGPQSVVVNLAAAQADLGHDVTLLTCATNPDDELQVPEHPRLQIQRVQTNGRLDRTLGRSLKHAINTLTQSDTSRPDILHIHSIWEPMLLAAASAARANNLPYILCPHGMLDPWALSEKPLKKKLALRLAYQRMIDRSAALHAISQYEADACQDFGYPNPIHIIPNGINLSDIDPLPAAGTFYQSHPELQNRPYILFLSRLHPVKRIDLLVNAFAKISTTHERLCLVVVGPDWGAQAAAEQLAAQHNLADRVIFPGPLWGEDKFAALTDAACFCLPSRHEAFSVAVLEAMAAQTAVVLSEQCHFPEIQNHDAGIVVDLDMGPQDTDQLAAALDSVASDPSRANQLGANARALVESQYTWTSLAQRCLDLYHSLTEHQDSQHS